MLSATIAGLSGSPEFDAPAGALGRANGLTLPALGCRRPDRQILRPAQFCGRVTVSIMAARLALAGLPAFARHFRKNDRPGALEELGA